MAARKLPNSVSTIKISPGEVNDQAAVILDLLCDSHDATGIQSMSALVKWFSDAHMTLRGNFERTISKKLVETFGRRIEVTG